MPVERAALRALAVALQTDIAAIQRLAGFVARFTADIESVPRDADRVWAAAMALHHLYNAIEHAFERIARTFDERVADQARWHRELLGRMFEELPGARPAVVSAEVRSTLEELLSFRHFVRHAYDVALEPRHIAVVLRFWEEQRTELLQQLRTFVSFVEGEREA